MNRWVRFSLFYHLWVFTLILLIQWTCFGPAIPNIGYSEFIDRVRSGAVEDVAIAQETIYGRMRGPEGEPARAEPTIEPPEAHTPWHLSWAPVKAWLSAGSITRGEC